MVKKLFTLIHGDEIRVAPKKKIIPASEFSTLMDASEVIEHARADVKNYHQKIASDCELIKENAFKEGYEEGFKQWAEHLEKLEEEISKAHSHLEKMVVPIALKAAEKIIGREIELAPETIVDIVIANIKSIAQHKKIIIFVNKNDWEVVEKNKHRIKELFEDLQSLSIRPRDDIEPAGCVIETEIGIINAQMTHRWNILAKAFEKLMKTSPESLKSSH